VYYKDNAGHILVITLYVDDRLFLGNSKNVIHDLKSYISAQFDMKDSKVAKYILEIEIDRDRLNINFWLARVCM
jgi:hypothetical protein